MEWKSGYNGKLIHDICYNCGSVSVKNAYPYFRRMLYNSPDTFWCEVLDDGKAFYIANKAKQHVRLIAIAVKQDYQGKRFGEEALFRLLSRVTQAGLDTLTFRTSQHESAQYFWLKQGAKIMDVKGEDYEMQIKIKK